MEQTVSIGSQSFEYMRQEQYFYIDKTGLIKEWWENKDDVTLITRPRRFGKTLNLSMIECFFSVRHAGRGGLFEGLSIWEDEEYRRLQGTYPVISFSFAEVKGRDFQTAREGIIAVLEELYRKHDYLLQSDTLSDAEKKNYDTFGQYVGPDRNPRKELTDTVISRAVKTLMSYLARHYGSKVIVLLDEYDTPMQEAFVCGYWEELAALIRSMFHSTFKTNDYLYRAILTGIMRVSKESVFSDLNNLMVVTALSQEYSTCFGFTQDEVFCALDQMGMQEEKEQVRFWYNGFWSGSRNDIYNPWSVMMFLRTKEYAPYWADSSSNALVSELIKKGTPQMKMQMEDLLDGRCLEAVLDEQAAFEQLNRKKDAVWSLLAACGYLKPENRRFDHAKGKFVYQLKITNYETQMMFREMIEGWFPEDETSYGNFKEALLLGDLEYMNQYMNEVSAEMFSSFDTGRRPSEKTHPERFYHGFVLGLIVDLAGRYHIRSNRQSGLGRYDVMMEPLRPDDDAVIMEFKVFSPQKDKTMQQAAENALAQIEKMKYDTELLARGIEKERIRHYGFVFDGQEVLICG